MSDHIGYVEEEVGNEVAYFELFGKFLYALKRAELIFSLFDRHIVDGGRHSHEPVVDRVIAVFVQMDIVFYAYRPQYEVKEPVGVIAHAIAHKEVFRAVNARERFVSVFEFHIVYIAGNYGKPAFNVVRGRAGSVFRFGHRVIDDSADRPVSDLRHKFAYGKFGKEVLGLFEVGKDLDRALYIRVQDLCGRSFDKSRNEIAFRIDVISYPIIGIYTRAFDYTFKSVP